MSPGWAGDLQKELGQLNNGRFQRWEGLMMNQEPVTMGRKPRGEETELWLDPGYSYGYRPHEEGGTAGTWYKQEPSGQRRRGQSPAFHHLGVFLSVSSTGHTQPGLQWERTSVS